MHAVNATGKNREPLASRIETSIEKSRWVTQAVNITVAVIGLAAVVAAIVLWPRGPRPLGIDQPNTYRKATVIAVSDSPCVDPNVGASTDCHLFTSRLTSGPDRGNDATFRIAATDFTIPTIRVGDRVVLLDVATLPSELRYSFSEFQRSTPLLALTLVFVVVVLVVGLRKGIRALAGLVASAGVLFFFILPALSRNKPAVLVALAGTVLIAFVAIYLAQGVSRATTVALAGTLLGLGLIAGLAALTTDAAHLSGLIEESAQIIRLANDKADLSGLLIAGMVLGALGVLTDITVTQVSTVAALRRVDPSLGFGRLYREANHVGRDHIASAVYTLVLAYAGAALTVLLVFVAGNQPVSHVLTSERVAIEIVRLLAGSIGLVLAGPITTALAAAVAVSSPPASLAGAHQHAHG
jgi:uncharacterized membrane protein